MSTSELQETDVLDVRAAKIYCQLNGRLHRVWAFGPVEKFIHLVGVTRGLTVTNAGDLGYLIEEAPAAFELAVVEPEVKGKRDQEVNDGQTEKT